MPRAKLLNVCEFYESVMIHVRRLMHFALLFSTAVHKGWHAAKSFPNSSVMLQKLLADPKTSKISQYMYSFQLAKTRSRTNPH